MHKEILGTAQKELLTLIKEFKREYYLVGGTAIAFHIGHRQSIDFDLFKPTQINKKRIVSTIEKQGHKYKLLYQEDNQIHLLVNNVKLTFFEYNFNIPHNEQLEDIITLPDLLDLAAMKSFALGRRAKWKDYVDLFCILKNHFSLNEIEKRSEMLFGELFSRKLFRQQLCFFEDIDYSEEVIFVNKKYEKEEIQNFLIETALTSL